MCLSLYVCMYVCMYVGMYVCQDLWLVAYRSYISSYVIELENYVEDYRMSSIFLTNNLVAYLTDVSI